MVLLLLQIKADLENLTNLTAKGGSDGSDFTFYFKVTSQSHPAPVLLFQLPNCMTQSRLTHVARKCDCV